MNRQQHATEILRRLHRLHLGLWIFTVVLLLFCIWTEPWGLWATLLVPFAFWAYSMGAEVSKARRMLQQGLYLGLLDDFGSLVGSRNEVQQWEQAPD